jgi:hypothetical protein
MQLSKTALIGALMLAGCGGTAGTSSTVDAGSTDEQDQTRRATGACTVGGAATGTLGVFAKCGNVATPDAPVYLFTLSTDPSGVKPAVSGVFPIGESSPTLGELYGLGDGAPGKLAAFFMYSSAAKETWMAGSVLQSDPTNGAVGLVLSTCDGSNQSHGTLTATLKPFLFSTGEVTLDCAF